MASIAPPSKKRARVVDVSSPVLPFQQQNLGTQSVFDQPHKVDLSQANSAQPNPENQWHFQQPNWLVCSPMNSGIINGVLPCVPLVDSRLYVSARTSTSGTSAVQENAVSHLYQQCDDTDTLVHLHMEQMRFGLQEARKKHSSAMLSVVQQQALKRLREKETEIGEVTQRNTELEGKVRQLAVERQFWFDVARNNEAVVCSLRATLDQVVESSTPGDNEEVVNPAADDAQSCCYGEDVKRWRAPACKCCGEGELSVLLLPCRHLCLCEDCELRIVACPICHSAKKACVRIALS